MAQHPQYRRDDKRKPVVEEPQVPRFLAPQSAPVAEPAPMPVYSDTDPGPQGDFSEVQQLPQYASPQASVPQPEAAQSMAVYRPPQTAQPPDAALALPSYQPGRVDVTEPAPLMVVNKNGAPTDRVLGDGTELQRREAELKAQESYKPKSHNSRLRSILIGAGRGFLHGGGLLGSMFGAVSHAVDPAEDEKYARHARIGELGHQIGGEYKRLEAASTLADQDTERRFKNAKIIQDSNTQRQSVYKDERDAALKNLEQFPALDPKNPTHAAAIRRAEASGWKIDPDSWGKGHVQTAFDVNAGAGVQYDPLSNSWKPMVDVTGKAISTRQPEKLGDLPKHFYELDGENKDTIYSRAKAKAGARDYSKGFQIDPAKVELLKKDGEKTEDTVARIKTMLNQGYDEAGNPIHFSEFARASDQDSARRYDAAVEAAAGPEMKKLNLYSLAVDQTSYAPATAQLQSINQFQTDYKTFWDKYTKTFKADPAKAAQMQAEYFNYIKGVRLR